MKKFWYLGVAIVVVAGGGLFLSTRGTEKKDDIEYRYQAIESGELVRSISATGQIVADTFVDVKCKAGGNVVKLAVVEGSKVKKGDLIAVIDPSDTKAAYDQASADLAQANARAAQAGQNLTIQQSQAKTDVADAENSVKLAQVRLEKARVEAIRQPKVTDTTIASAVATNESAKAALKRLQDVTIPQQKREAQSAVNEAKVRLENTKANVERQQNLFDKGFVSLSTVQTAQTAYQSAVTAHDNAVQRLDTLQKDFEAQLRDSNLSLERSEAALRQARANTAQNDLAVISVREAERTLSQARIALERARANAALVGVKANDVVAAKAATVRGNVSLQNAKVQLDSTTVLAPRDGVVTKKYIEEGTIIPAGTSTFAQGTSIVQISDVTQLYVECAVDEADIANVKKGQPVRIVTEAFPGEFVDGEVDRVNPAAVTEANITAIKVRVKIDPGFDVKLMPGMNATCEFITLQKKNVIVAPSQAVKNEGGKSYVEIKSSDPLKPEKREIKTGEFGNDGVEVVSGLKAGEEVVTAKVDLAQLRETQKKMVEAQQGGGLAGGGGGRPTGARPSGGRGGGAGGGGSRGSGGSGGARGGGK